jgi:hypothetical protein
MMVNCCGVMVLSSVLLHRSSNEAQRNEAVVVVSKKSSVPRLAEAFVKLSNGATVSGMRQQYYSVITRRVSCHVIDSVHFHYFVVKFDCHVSILYH